MLRTEIWGYVPEEALSNEELIKERYQGIRPAPGYPAYRNILSALGVEPVLLETTAADRFQPTPRLLQAAGGELDGGLDPVLAADALAGPLFYARLVAHQPFPPERVGRLVALVLG